MRQTLQQHLTRPLPVLVISLVILVLGMLGISQIDLSMGNNMFDSLIVQMAATGILLTVVSFGVYRSGALQYLRSLRLLLLVMVGVMVAVMLFYFWLLSETLFAYSHYLPVMTMVLFFAGVSAIALGYFASRAMTQRLSALSEAATQVAQGDFSTRLSVVGNDEIAQLIDNFNAMARDLEQVEEQKQQLEQTRRDLVAWVSHDLRTPLTSMRVMLEALSDGVITDEETQQRYINNTLSEIEHLSLMITDLFEMAKLDVGHIELDLMPTPIADLISDTMGSLMAKASKKNIALEGDVSDDLDLVYIAPDKIQRVLKNLVGNAIQYTPAGETVRICATPCDGSSVRVDVHNTGVHIPEDDLPHLFDSFYRGEKSRAMTEDDQRGTGLGLAIARGFIQAHGGRIWAESTPQTGTTFSFIVPNQPVAGA